ncbi:MAG: hypothetical protein KDA89_19675 [Planctomycetaceae bacterium]|nr:hypothetical protein [Planctomycetaceae bacterium]
MATVMRTADRTSFRIGAGIAGTTLSLVRPATCEDGDCSVASGGVY